MTKTFWWNDIPNYGDQLSPLILGHYSGLSPEWSPVEQARVIAVGSILEHIPRGWTGHVAGAGRLLEDSDINIGGATVHAVRGPLSAKGIRGDFALGDPALLADEMVTVETRDIELGIVPHWSDTDVIHRHLFQPYGPVVITPWADPLWVVGMIGRCKKIVASSLHGVILADAFGIPRRTEVAGRFRADVREGDMFKFRDYNASVGVPFRVGETQQASRGVVEDRKHELYDMFRAIGRMWELR
jgi:hypothetical protein